jgi:uncharacterized protein YbaR (Trm112 family)
MFLPLTDLLTCPRCGPEAGLILLAHRIEDRRVLEGALGCPRCQERYRVAGGFAELRYTLAELEGGAGAALEGGAAVGASAGAAGAASEGEEAVRLAALLGIMEGGGYVLVVGPGVTRAPALAALLEGLEVVAVDASVAAWPEERGVSRLGATRALPLHGRSMRGVVLTGGAESLLEEAVRVLAPGGRLVVEPASTAVAARVEAAGLKVRAHEGQVLVAMRV